MEMPETRYAKTRDGVHIAYQVVGTGPIDLLRVGSSPVTQDAFLRHRGLRITRHSGRGRDAIVRERP